MKHKGEVWCVNGRKGPLTIRMVEDVDEAKDGFFEAEILSGKVRYMSAENNYYQKTDGQGTPGHVETFRTTLTRFNKRVLPTPARRQR